MAGSALSKVLLAARIWLRLGRVWFELRRHPLPEAVRGLARRAGRPTGVDVAPRRFGKIVFRVLRIGPWRPRCLYQATVLFTFLHDRGDPVELVIGLPSSPGSKDAHAWVELSGEDVGPPPGQGSHEELVRYR